MRLCTLISLLLISALLCGQKRSAQKLYDQALIERDYNAAAVLFEKAIAKDSSYASAYLKLARVYGKTQRSDLQVSTLQLAAKHAMSRLDIINARLARAAYLNGQYGVAKEALYKLEVDRDNELMYLNSCIDFSLLSVQDNRPFSPDNLGRNVNTEFHDYWPSFSIDESQIITTVFETDSNLPMDNENFYSSHRDGGEWTRSVPMGETLNTIGNEGAQCLSADGTVMLFTACNRRSGFGMCDLYISSQKDGVWSVPMPLPAPINSPSWEGHPCLSADGRWLYFSSDRPGGYGGKDLYMVAVNLGNTVTFGPIYNLGKYVNTQGDEISPFIHPDGKTLYFSSDGHIGLGRQDIYIATQGDNGYREEPVNLGYPINTNNDEIGLVVSAQGDVGYFSTERDGSRLKDIYSFAMPEEVRPLEVTYFKAKVFDSEDDEPVLSKIELRSVATGELLFFSPSNSEFILALPLGEDYAVHVSSPGYLFYSDNFPLTKHVETPFEKNIFLSPIKKGEAIVLRNILFRYDSSSLDSTFTEELEMVVELIKNNPDLMFEVAGHTDDLGGAEYNQHLSEARALAVYQFLVDKGVEASKVTYAGYGATRPISTNDDDNRRTELIVR